MNLSWQNHPQTSMKHYKLPPCVLCDYNSCRVDMIMASPELTNIVDLEGKLQSVVAFISSVSSKDLYDDEFQFFIESNHKDSLKSLVVYWSCNAFYLQSQNEDCNKDKRDHQLLLQHFFKDYDMAIHKYYTRWQITISTSEHRHAIHHMTARLPTPGSSCVESLRRVYCPLSLDK